MKKILIVIDMQTDFISGQLGTKEAQGIIPNVVNKIKEYHKNGHIVLSTQDTHYENYLETQEGELLPIPHCIEGTTGWNIVTEVQQELDKMPELSEYVRKTTFGYAELGSVISNLLRCDDYEVELVGVCTDICVVANALIIKTHCPEIKVFVDASCCAGTSIENHRHALATMKSCQVHVINEKNYND